MEYLVNLIAQYPQAASVFLVIGVLRAIFKPLQLVVQAYVDSPPDNVDNVNWAAIKEAKWFKVLAWLLDYTASIKVPVK